jgi:hypothetical protein
MDFMYKVQRLSYVCFHELPCGRSSLTTNCPVVGVLFHELSCGRFFFTMTSHVIGFFFTMNCPVVEVLLPVKCPEGGAFLL